MVFWLLTKLSKEYSTDLEVRVEYVHLPSDKVVRNRLPEKLTLKVKGTGWELLRKQLAFSKSAIRIDVNDFIQSGRIITNNYKGLFASQLGGRIEVLRVSPPEITFEFEKKSSRKLPVRLVGQISTDPQYGLIGEIILTPDSILVTGPASVVDTMQAVRSEVLKLTGLDKKVTGSVALSEAPLSGVEYESKEVHYEIPVVQFTESSLDVPIEIAHADKEALLLIRKAKISFQLPVDKLEEVEAGKASGLFRIEADFSLVEPGDSTVPLVLVQAPAFIRNPKIDPEEAPFLYINP